MLMRRAMCMCPDTNDILKIENMISLACGESSMIPIVKERGDVPECNNSGNNILSHTLKIWEIIVESQFKEEVELAWEKYN